MHIINLIDNLGRVNFGIWNAAVATAPMLQSDFGCSSHAWFPALDEEPELPFVQKRAFSSLGTEQLEQALQEGDRKSVV